MWLAHWAPPGRYLILYGSEVVDVAWFSLNAAHIRARSFRDEKGLKGTARQSVQVDRRRSR
jgi:hypothetical protein